MTSKQKNVRIKHAKRIARLNNRKYGWQQQDRYQGWIAGTTKE